MRDHPGMRRTRHELLTIDRLNRATLARQLLLEPASLEPVAALERTGGTQAQEPASPYLALWARLAAFDPGTLHAAFLERGAVKATLMRVTLHAVSRRDYGHLVTALEPLRGADRQTRRGVARPDRIPELAGAAAAYAVEPRRNADLRAYVEELAGEGPLDEPVWWWVRRHLPLVHVPEEVPWSFSRRPVLTTPATWLGDNRFADGGAGGGARALEHLVRRYLGAFGPASTADVAAWSGMSAVTFAAAIAALNEAGELRRFSDEAGRVLLDLVDAPLPDADVPAPPRLLPMWDSVLLAHRDRTRVIADAHRPTVIGRNGDVLPSFLVDGRVAGLWWAESEGGPTRLVLEPFGRLRPEDRRALTELGDRLAAFVSPLEPRVYARYRGSRARR